MVRETTEEPSVTKVTPYTMSDGAPEEELAVASGTDPSTAITETDTKRIRLPRQLLNICKLGDISEEVFMSVEGNSYILGLSRLEDLKPQNSYMAVDYTDPRIDELYSLIVEHETFAVGVPPEGRKVLSSKFVDKKKACGRLKSRLCLRGFTMIEGEHFGDTFAPVSKMTTFRILMHLIAMFNLFTGNLDVKTAFLHATMTYEVWMSVPSDVLSLLIKLLASIKKKRTGDHKVDDKLKAQYLSVKAIADGLKSDKKLRLLKSIYGGKNAPRDWWTLIDDFLKSLGFKPCPYDHCLYSLVVGIEFVLLLLYVDDIIIAATSESLVMKYVSIISKRFKTSHVGELTEFLNLEVTHNRIDKKVYLSQQRYIETFHRQFDFSIKESVDTPMQENLKLPLKEEENLSPKQEAYVNEFPYRQIIGCVLYINLCTMPIISYAVSVLAGFCANPSFLACKALVRLVQYIFNNRSTPLALGDDCLHITSYGDSDWAGCAKTRKSRSGVLNFIGSSIIMWVSRMQTIVAQSTMEAEYVALCLAIQNSNYIKNLLNSLEIKQIHITYAPTVFCDNEAAVSVSWNPKHHQRTKHIELKYQYCADQVKKKAVVIDNIKSADNCSDVCTKPLGRTLLGKHQRIVNGYGKAKYSSKRVKMDQEENELPCPHCTLNKLCNNR